MTFELRVCAAIDASSMAEGWATHAISLVDIRHDPITPLARNALVLIFEDSERPDIDGPNARHVEAVMDFTRGLTVDARLLVHCVAGLSRSTAMATAILVQHGVRADLALARVGQMRPDMWPNERLCRFADAALKTGGTIMAAVSRWRAEQIAALEASGEIVA